MKKILLVDDSEGKLALMQHMLTKHAWKGETHIANTTEAAKKLIDEITFDFALIDFYVPSKNGPSVITYLKAKNPAARVALISSADTMENFEKAKAAGAETCICTSYQSDQVEVAFKELLSEWLSVSSRA